MFVRREPEKPGEHLHRFGGLSLRACLHVIDAHALGVFHVSLHRFHLLSILALVHLEVLTNSTRLKLLARALKETGTSSS